MKRLLLPLFVLNAALAATASAQDPAIPDSLREAFAPGAAAPAARPDADDPPAVLLRLESADAALEALRVLVEPVADGFGETNAPALVAAQTTGLFEGVLAGNGLSAMDRAKPVFAAVWNIDPDNWRRSDFLLSLPLARAGVDPAVARNIGAQNVVGADGLAAFPFGSFWVAFEGDRTLVATRESAFPARAAFHDLRPALPDAVLSARVASIDRTFRRPKGKSPDGTVPSDTRDPRPSELFDVRLLSDPRGATLDSATGRPREFGGAFLISLGAESGFDVDAACDFALVVSHEKGLLFSKSLRPIPGTAAPEVAALPAPALLRDGDFAAVPADALAWTLRSAVPTVAFDKASFTVRFFFNDTRSNRLRTGPLRDLASAVGRLLSDGALRAALRPAPGGWLRLDLRRDGGGAAARAFGKTLARARENEWKIAGTNGFAVFFPGFADIAADGLSAALHPRAAGFGAFADGFGDDAEFRVADEDGAAILSLAPDGATNAPAAGPAPALPLDAVRARFPGWSPASVFAVRAAALEALLSSDASPSAGADGDALFYAAGPVGDEWVGVLSASPDALRAALRPVGRAFRRDMERKRAEAEAQGPWADIRRRAEAGDAGAQFSLGYGYANEQGDRHDWENALVWFRKAAEQGHVEAQYAMGCAYGMGNGVGKDLKQAAVWFRKAAEQGHAGAQYGLGKCLYVLAKNGAEATTEEAFSWFRKGSEQGDEKSGMMLAAMLASGEGCERDAENGTVLLRGYAETGSTEEVRNWAAKRLRRIEEKAAAPAAPPDSAARDHLADVRRRAEAGDAEAQYALGVGYANERGERHDWETAIVWFRKAAEQGHAEAQYALGRCLYVRAKEGAGETKEEAFSWIQKGYEQGNEQCKVMLAAMLLKGEGCEKDVRKGAGILRDLVEKGSNEEFRKWAAQALRELEDSAGGGAEDSRP